MDETRRRLYDIWMDQMGWPSLEEIEALSNAQIAAEIIEADHCGAFTGQSNISGFSDDEWEWLNTLAAQAPPKVEIQTEAWRRGASDRLNKLPFRPPFSASESPEEYQQYSEGWMGTPHLQWAEFHH